jgi:hypothetical protein
LFKFIDFDEGIFEIFNKEDEDDEHNEDNDEHLMT